jgi:hypothetical protein
MRCNQLHGIVRLWLIQARCGNRWYERPLTTSVQIQNLAASHALQLNAGMQAFGL